MTKTVPSFFLLLAPALISSSLAQEYQCTLSAPIDLDDGVTLEHVKNSAAGTYTVRLTYSQGQAWVGIGINTLGDDKMVPGNAVIGRVEADGSTSVLQYSMVSDSKDGSGVLPMADQNLMEASFVQSDTESILTYTQLLNDDSFGSITDESSWIWAIGLPDNAWEGKHKVNGSFFLALEDNCVSVTAAPTDAPTISPITDPPTNHVATSHPTESPTLTAPLDDLEEVEENDLATLNSTANATFPNATVPVQWDELEEVEEDEIVEEIGVKV